MPAKTTGRDLLLLACAVCLCPGKEGHWHCLPSGVFLLKCHLSAAVPSAHAEGQRC